MISAKKTIYLVNIDFPPISGPGVWRILALAKYAAQSGFDVHVFCSDRSFWHNRQDNSLLSQLPEGVRVTRIKSIFANDLLDFFERWKMSSSPIKKRIGDQLHWWITRYFPDQILHWAIKASVIILFKSLGDKPKAIFTTGPMHLVHIAGWVLSTFKPSTRWIMDYRDPWTGDPAYGQVFRGAYQEGLMSWLESRLTRKANYVTSVSAGFLSAIKDQFGQNQSDDKFKLIPNGHDLELSEAIAKENASNLFARESDHFVVHFNGTIQEGNDTFQDLVEAISIYNQKNTIKIVFSVCGANRRMMEMISALSLESYFIDNGSLSQKRSQEISSGADALLVIVRSDLITARGVIPAKLYEALALGKPVIALVPEQSDVRDILAADTGSVCTSPSNVLDIEKSLSWIIDRNRNLDINTAETEALGRLQIAAQFSRRDLCKRILDLVENEPN